MPREWSGLNEARQKAPDGLFENDKFYRISDVWKYRDEILIL